MTALSAIRVAALALVLLLVLYFQDFRNPLLFASISMWLLWPWREDSLTGRVLAFLGLAIVLLVATQIGSALVPLAAAGILAYLMEPAVSWMANRKLSRTMAALVGIGGGLLICGILLLFLLPPLASETAELLRNLPAVKTKAEAWIIQELPGAMQVLGLESSDVIDWLRERGPALLKSSLQALGTGSQLLAGGLSGIAGSVMNIVLVPVFALSFSAAGPALKQEVLHWIPGKKEGMVKEIAGEVDRIISGYLRGQLLVSLIVGLLTSLGLWICGMPYPLLLGMATGILNIIPLVGVTSMFVLSMIVAAFQPDWSLMLFKVALVFAVVQGAESFLITPRILGQSVGLHPALALAALLVFGSLLGLPGMILAVPLAAVLVYLYNRIKKSRSPE